MSEADPRRRIDPVKALLAAGGLASVLGLPFAQFAANRIVAGTDWALGALSPAAAAASLAVWALVGLSAFGGRAGRGPWWGLVVPLPLALGLAGVAAGALTLAGADPIARVTLGSGFWVTVGLTAVLAVALPSRPLVRVLAWAGALGAAGLAAWLGAFDALSLAREARNLGATFGDELGRHLGLTAGAVGAGTLLGLGLGVAAHRSPSWRLGGFLTLNFLQTVPSLALFGLLILPLAWLSTAYPWLRDWGIRGIGPTPALIALTLYAALPVARNTLTALDELPGAVLDAGRGMGMSGLQLAWWAVVPLAWPAVLAGVRIATVQTVGNTVVAALIGAGGLGVFIFQGLGQTAMDLVLLGTLPVVGLALAADALLGLPARIRGGRP